MEGHIYGYAGLYSTGEKMEIRCYRGIVTEKCSMERQKRGIVFSSKLEGNVLWLSMSYQTIKPNQIFVIPRMVCILHRFKRNFR